MKATTFSATARHATNAIFIASAILLVAAVETGVSQTVGLGDRVAFWLLFLVGITLCARGPLGQGTRYGWRNARHMVGYILGLAALLLGAAVLFDFSLPGSGSDRAAVLALGLVMAIKAAIARLYPRAA